MPQKLYLIPQPISEEENLFTIPLSVKKGVDPLRHFVVENEKSAKRFLRKLIPQFPLDECRFFSLNEHIPVKEIAEILNNIGANDAGLLSEAGSPCVADPGRELVLLAHQGGWDIIPLVGPSSILLALMASGLNGQNFSFHGYLPKEREERIKKIKTLQEISFRENQTQIFMEAPYRNENLLEDILTRCDADTLLCIAAGLTSTFQFIKTRSIKEWRHNRPGLHKNPAIFLIEKR